MENLQDNHIGINHVRPRFQIDIDLTLEEITQRFNNGFLNHNSGCNGKVSYDFIVVRLPEKDQKYWSPQLSIMAEENTENNFLLQGLYGPRPNVWTMFVFFYFVIALAILVVSMIGLSNWTLGESAQIFWFVPLLILVFCSLYLVAYIGQKLSRRQMRTLHDFVEDVLGVKLPVKD